MLSVLKEILSPRIFGRSAKYPALLQLDHGSSQSHTGFFSFIGLIRVWCHPMFSQDGKPNLNGTYILRCTTECYIYRCHFKDLPLKQHFSFLKSKLFCHIDLDCFDNHLDSYFDCCCQKKIHMMIWVQKVTSQI